MLAGNFRPSLEGDARTFGVKTTRVEYPAGVAGVRLSLQEIGRLIREGMITPSMRGFAEMVVRRAGVPVSRHLSDKEAAQIFLDYVRENVRYRYDPDQTEMTLAAPVTLCIPGAPMCIPVGDCFPEGTLVLRSDHALVPIEMIGSGEKIWGRDEWTTVQSKAFKGDLKVDAVEMNNGSTMYLTHDHKVYVGRCKHDKGSECPTCPPNARQESFVRVTVGDLQEDDVLLQPDRIEFGVSTPDPDRMYVEGLALADGWVSHETKFSIAGRDGMRKEAQKHEVKKICDRLGIETHWHRRYITVRDREWAQRIAGLGARARFKHLETIGLSEASAEAALRGLMADSTANTHGEGRTYSTTSPLMATQVRVLHRMFGRSTSVKMLTPEQHGGAGKHPLWRIGVRAPQNGRAGKTLMVRSIERNVRKIRCWDIQTEDHYVYLPEHDVTVSNCDDLVTALGSMMGAYGIQVRVMKQSFGDSSQEHVLIVFKDGDNGWLPADPSAPGKPVGWRASATNEVIVNPADPKSLDLQGEPEALFVGVGRIGGRPQIKHIGLLDPTQTVAQVLAFRAVWDSYVTGVARAAETCAAAWQAAADQKKSIPNTPTSSSPINSAQFSIPPDATTLQLWATAQSQNAGLIMTMWNEYAGLLAPGNNEGAYQVTQIADQILAYYQHVVLQIGQFYAPEVARDCPNTPLPTVPTFDAQAQMVAQVEASGVVARGVLGFFGLAADGALQFYNRLGQSAENVVKSAPSVIPWIAGAVIAVAAAGAAIEVAPVLLATKRAAANEARRLVARR